MSKRTDVTKAAPPQQLKAPEPQESTALDTMGYASYRNRSSALFIDDPLVRELQGRNAERTIDRMLLDPVIAGTVERSALTLRGAPWTVEPGGKADIDKRLADRLGQDLDDLETGFASTIASMADAIAWGFSLHEVLFRIEADGFHWADFSPREQRSVDHWDIDESTGKVLNVYQRVTTLSGITGRFNQPRLSRAVPIPGWKLLHFRTHPASGRPEGRSLIRNAFIPWTDKQELRRIVKIGLRRDFTGVAKYEVPAEILSKGATPEQKAALAQAVQLVQEFERDQREGLVLPSSIKPGSQDASGYKLELMSSGGRRQLELEALWDMLNREMAIGLLAEWMLLSQNQRGSQALGETTVSFYERAINAWLDIAGELMGHRLALVYQAFNPQFAAAKLPKFVHGDVDKRDLKQIGAFLQQVLAGGAIVPDPSLEEWLRDAIGAPPSVNTAPMNPDEKPPVDGEPADGTTTPPAGEKKKPAPEDNAAVHPVT